MMQVIRDRVTGPVIWVVIGVMTLGLGIFGIQTLGIGHRADMTVAEVGDSKISPEMLDRANNQRLGRVVSQHHGELPDDFDATKFKNETLDSLVEQYQLREFARTSGFRVGDQAVLDDLQGTPPFLIDGKFSQSSYEQTLAGAGIKPEAYEASVRERLVAEQVLGSVSDSAIATSSDAWNELRIQRQSRKVGVAQIPAAPFRDKVQVTDAQVAARYEADKGLYQAPERIKVAYVELDRAKVSVTEQPSKDQLKDTYDEVKDKRFFTPEERRARHVLVQMGKDKDAAKKKAEDLLKAIKGGKDFAEVAKESSDDPVSKAKGGDLGFSRKGDNNPAFDEALFDLKQGEVSEPVETPFGWDIVKLEEIRPEGTKPFEDPEVQTDLVDAWRTREAGKRFQELSSKLDDAAFTKSTIEDVAKDLQLEVQKTDWFTRAGLPEGIAAADGVKAAAFSKEVALDGQNSKSIAIDNDHLVVLHKSEYEAAHQRPLEDVKDDVKKKLVEEGATALARKEGDALIADLKSGKALTAATAAHAATVKFDGEVTRVAKGVDAPVLKAVFAMPRPASGATEYRAIDLDGGDVAVIALAQVVDPAKPEAGGAILKQQLTTTQQALAMTELEAYRKAMGKEVKVERREVPKDDNQPGS